MSKPILSLDFNFYGVRTCVVCQLPSDIEHLHYYYGDHQVYFSKPHIIVHFKTSSVVSFFDNIRDKSVEKRILVDIGEGAVLYEAFHLGAKRPTPLPPIGFMRMGLDLFLYHGAALLLPGFGAVLIRGGSGVGKSIFLLSLLAQTHGHFVSDDMLVMDSTGKIWPIFRPVGIREVAMAQITAEQRSAAFQAKAIETSSGTTYMVRPAHLAPLAAMHGHPVALDIQLSKSSHFQFTSTRFSHHERLDINFDPCFHLKTAINLVLTRISTNARVTE